MVGLNGKKKKKEQARTPKDSDTPQPLSPSSS